MGYTLPLNSVSDYDFPTDMLGWRADDGNLRPLEEIDDDIKLPLSERYFLGGLGEYQLRGFKARSVGPRRPILRELFINFTQPTGLFIPVGRVPNLFNPTLPTQCSDLSVGGGGNGNGVCNDISDKDIDDFEDLDETDVIGGNKFISTSLEYRFPISEAIGLQGLVFFDMGNAFAEGENLFDVGEWRYGAGAGVQWFSPFGPLAVILGFPLDPLEDEDSPVFEFSVGGQGF